MTRFKRFIWNGILITLVSILIRGVSVSFNVYLSNRVGAVAMGLFTLISTVYGFSITVATSGIGLATTTLVAEAMGKADEAGARTPPWQNPRVLCTVRRCSIYALCFSFGSGLILFFFAPLIGGRFLNDPRTVLSLRILAFTLPPIAFSSVLSGYFIAVRRVYKNALVQTIGHGIRIYTCVLLIGWIGAKDVESACVAVVLGGAISEGSSFLIQYLLFFLEKRRYKKEKISYLQGRTIEKKLLRTALPVAFSAYVRSGLVTVEHMLIPRGLEKVGNSRDQALASYGILHSMVFPLVLFPSAISSSFSGLLVPEIAEATAINDQERIHRIIRRVYHTVLIFSVGCAGIMLCFAHELGDLFFPKTDAGSYILMIAPLVPVMYLDTSTDSILKGMGEQVYCMGVNIVDAFLSVILVWVLLPLFGINGYIVTVYFTEIVNASLSIYRLFSVSGGKAQWADWIFKPLLSIGLATAVMRYLLRHFDGQVDSFFKLGAHAVLTVILYVLFLFLFRSLRFKDLFTNREIKSNKIHK